MEIVDIKSKALKKLILKDDGSLLPNRYLVKIRAIIDMLVAAEDIRAVMRYPYGRPHRLRGDRSDTYAISVYANWRITFVHNEKENTLHILDYEDYH